jgi:hypothetical protein
MERSLSLGRHVISRGKLLFLLIQRLPTPSASDP